MYKNSHQIDRGYGSQTWRGGQTGRTCDGVWVKGKYHGLEREVYIYQVADIILLSRIFKHRFLRPAGVVSGASFIGLGGALLGHLPLSPIW